MTDLHAPSLRDYARVLWRRRWIVVLVALIAPAAAVAFSLHQTPVYSSSSEVLLQNSNLASSLTGVADTTLFQDPAWLDQTQADLASVPAVAQMVIAKTGVKGMTPAGFLADSSVTPHSDSDLLDFSVSNTDPALARSLATAYAQAYVRYRGTVDTASIIRALKEARSHLAQLRRQGDTSSSLYQSVDNKVQTLRTLEALQTSNAYVIRTADSAVKVSPKPTRDGVLALALGLILGVGLAFLRETLDTRVRSGDEIAAALHLPLLARLSEPPKRLASKRQLAAVVEPAGPAAESFRLLRTNLDFVNLQRETRSILVTSALEGEGKSTTAANLAVTLARAGRRVVLVDLDLRRPSLHTFFGLERPRGLTDVALGELGLEEALQTGLEPGGEGPSFDPARPGVAWTSRPDDGGNGNGNGGHARAALANGMLRILPAGSLPPDPGEFVQSPAVDRILRDLQQQSDIVIVDGPPLLSVGDALSLSQSVGGLLLVARLTSLRRPLLRELHRVLEAIPAAKLGFVLAGADAEEGYGTARYNAYYGTPRASDLQPTS